MLRACGTNHTRQHQVSTLHSTYCLAFACATRFAGSAAASVVTSTSSQLGPTQPSVSQRKPAAGLGNKPGSASVGNLIDLGDYPSLASTSQPALDKKRRAAKAGQDVELAAITPTHQESTGVTRAACVWATSYTSG